MKVIFFLVASLLVGTSSAQTLAQNISVDVINILNEIDSSANQLYSQIASDLCSGVGILRDFLLGGWRALKFVVSFATSPSYINVLDAGVNTTVETLINDCSNDGARNATLQMFQTARSIYSNALKRYISLSNSTFNIYQCWNSTRPQIVQVLRNFINTTRTQTRPYVSQRINVTTTELQKLVSNFTSYQFNVPLCFSFSFSKVRECRDRYWKANSPFILAAMENFQTTVGNQRNATAQALESIITTNAQSAENQLKTINEGFEACVNSTTSTTQSPTTTSTA